MTNVHKWELGCEVDKRGTAVADVVVVSEKRHDGVTDVQEVKASRSLVRRGHPVDTEVPVEYMCMYVRPQSSQR